MKTDGNRATRWAIPSTYCGHNGAREIHVYIQYADANAIRLRSAEAAAFDDLHVSRLYEIPGGWGWTICRQCRLLEKKPA